MGACAPLVWLRMHAAQGSLWSSCSHSFGVGCGVAHESLCGHSFGVGQRMEAHVALIDVRCMRHMGACACAVTREKDRQKEKEHGITYSMAPAYV
jgi:hypothetical protein